MPTKKYQNHKYYGVDGRTVRRLERRQAISNAMEDALKELDNMAKSVIKIEK